MSDDTTLPTAAPTDVPAGTPTGILNRTAILVAAFDSQLKWAGTIRRALQAHGFSCQVIVPSDIRHAVSDSQLADYGGSSVQYLPWAELIQRTFEVDAVVLAIQGPHVSRFTHDVFDAVAQTGKRPPVTISGWVGVIIEKITAGYLERYATDVVAVNSRSDLRTFQAVAGSLELPTENLLLSGLPLLTGGYREAPVGTPIRTVMFADQPTVPSTAADRLYLYRQLIDYAVAHPDRSVVLKPRHRIGEDTFHKMKFHPEVLLADIAQPANFSIDYTPISQRLVDLDLMLTVSSTAALEAVGAGVRTAFIADLDIREQLGNHIFLDSGLLRTFDQVSRDEIGTPTPSWIDDYFFATDDRSPAEQIAARALELVEDPERTAPAAWQTPFFASQHKLFAYRRETVGTVVKPAITGWAARARPVAEWVLPYGVQVRLRRTLKTR
jgi:putative glycosyltransferase DUF6716